MKRIIALDAIKIIRSQNATMLQFRKGHVRSVKEFCPWVRCYKCLLEIQKEKDKEIVDAMRRKKNKSIKPKNCTKCHARLINQRGDPICYDCAKLEAEVQRNAAERKRKLIAGRFNQIGVSGIDLDRKRRRMIENLEKDQLETHVLANKRLSRMLGKIKTIASKYARGRKHKGKRKLSKRTASILESFSDSDSECLSDSDIDTSRTSNEEKKVRSRKLKKNVADLNIVISNITCRKIMGLRLHEYI